MSPKSHGDKRVKSSYINSRDMIIAELTLTPLGVGTGVSKYVKKAIEVIKNSGLNYKPTPMSTIVEARTLEEIFDLVKRAEEAMLSAGAQRVIVDIKIDHRIDKDATMESKLKVIGED